MGKSKKKKEKFIEQTKPVNTAIPLPKQIIKENLLLFMLMFFGVLVLYGNSINGQFLTADDIPGIVNNPMVKDFSGSLQTYEIEKMYPAIIYKLFGMNVVPFHLFSVLFHFVNAILVFIFILILFGKKEALVASLIFMAHPLNTEAVAWISAYGYLIYGFITLLILTTYTLWAKTKKNEYLALSVGIFIFSIIFYRKPWVALIPVYVVLIDQLIIEKKINFEKAKNYIWFLVPTLIYSFVYVRDLLATRTQLLSTVYYNDPDNATPYFTRILYTTYMTGKLLLFPSGLTIYHEGENVKSVEDFTVRCVIYTVLLIGGTIYLFVKKSKRDNELRRYIATLLVLIYSTMAMSYYPTVVVWAMADRYLYVASVFFGSIVALLYIRFGGKELGKWILILVLTFYSVKTIWRTNDWKSSRNLWIATQKVSPYSYRVYNNLGDVSAQEGNYEDAIRHFQTSLQISPGFADAVHNLGYAYYQLGDVEKAKMYLQKSFEMNPMVYPAAYKLGVIAYQEGNIPLAKDYMLKVLQVNPNFEPAITALRILNTPPAAQQ